MDKINTIIETDLGKVGITPQLPGLENYDELDLIVQDGRAYLSLKAGNQADVTDNSWWLKITENAYDMAVRLGLFEGTEEEWVTTLSAASLEAARLCYEQTEKCKEATEEAIRATEAADHAAERANTLSENRDKVIGGVWWRYNESSGEYESTGITAKGSDFVIRGFYDSLEELMDEVPDPKQGDVYGVGAEAPYQVFIYDERREEWVDNGTLKGEKGDKGETGEAGQQGVKGDKGETGATGPQGEKGDTGATGPQGPKGDTGATGPQGLKGDKGDKGDTGQGFQCPTLANQPGENTLTYIANGGTYTFTIGQQARVYDSERKDYVFYQLYDIESGNKAVWKIAGNGNGNSVYETIKLMLTSNEIQPDNGLTGAQFTITYDNRVNTYTWNGTEMEITIPHKASYKIECLDFNCYTKPASVSYQAVGGNLRFVTLQYEALKYAKIIFNRSISDPQCITGDVNKGVIRKLIAKFRRCMAKNTASGEVTISYLDDNNSNFYEDGTPSDLTGNEGDVMVYMPEFYYKYESISDKIFAYYISLEKIDNNYIQVPASLIGAYGATRVNDKLYSHGNTRPFGSTGYSNPIITVGRGSGYTLMDFQQHCVIAMLFYSKYGTLKSSDILSNSLVNYNNITGQTNDMGIKEADTNIIRLSNFLGIEHIHPGGEYLINLEYKHEQSQWMFILTDLNGSIKKFPAPSATGGITKMALENGPFFDMIPLEIGGNETTHYCANINYSSTSMNVRRAPSTNNFSNFASLNVSAQSTTLYFRLSFRGTIKEMNNSSGFRSLTFIK